jgi:hypothetical protein
MRGSGLQLVSAISGQKNEREEEKLNGSREIHWPFNFYHRLRIRY